LEREQYLYLTTRGRKTGRPREIEIWFIPYEGRFYVIAESTTSNWVRNLTVHPAVSVRVAQATFSAHARLVDAASEPDLKARIETLFRAKYGWGQGQIVEITPETPKS
jgi:deazaflavin-dependent oxidoreductase (nitroreductase family)